MNMNKKFEIIQSRPEGSDCTAPYNIHFYKKCTVKEFIDEILSRKDEWGRIIVSHDRASFEVEYRYGELKTPISNEILERTIIFADGSGGWTSMDYRLYL